jgi:uncharacterized protein (DUF302 family)
MNPETRDAILTWVVDRPFEAAFPRLRRAILDSSLGLMAEIDAAQRAKRALQIEGPPCRVLLIDHPALLLATTAINCASALFLPVPVVISGAGPRTLVHLLSPEHIRHSELPIGIKVAVLDLQRQLVHCFERSIGRARPPQERTEPYSPHAQTAMADPIDRSEAVSP